MNTKKWLIVFFIVLFGAISYYLYRFAEDVDSDQSSWIDREGNLWTEIEGGSICLKMNDDGLESILSGPPNPNKKTNFYWAFCFLSGLVSIAILLISLKNLKGKNF